MSSIATLKPGLHGFFRIPGFPNAAPVAFSTGASLPSAKHDTWGRVVVPWQKRPWRTP